MMDIHAVVLRPFETLPSPAAAGSSAGSCAGASARNAADFFALLFALLFAIMIAASAVAFFCASRACRVLSATNLLAATRLEFCAGLVLELVLSLAPWEQSPLTRQYLLAKVVRSTLCKSILSQKNLRCNCSIMYSNYAAVGEDCSGIFLRGSSPTPGLWGVPTK